MANASDYDGLEERITQLRRRDRRYSRNAYFFVLDALDHTIEGLGRDRRLGETRHVGGQELLAGLGELAADQFGPLASLCLERWGIKSSEDVGEVVFNLVDCGLLSRRPEDSRLDFQGGYDFARAFEKKYRERLAAISRPPVSN